MSESAEKAQLAILIAGKWYYLDRIAFDGERTNATGWKLTHFEDTESHGPYDIIKQPSGRLTCQCADYEFVKQKYQAICKHIAAIQEKGLL